MVGELILVEWIFSWPGLGRLLAFTLLGPRSNEPPRRFSCTRRRSA